MVNIVMLKQFIPSEDTKDYLLDSASKNFIPVDHINYLHNMKAASIEPKVIYDIGACLKHWTKSAREVWPNADFYLFEAVRAFEFLYEGENYNINVLSDEEKTVDFYEHPMNPGGNSIYRENIEYNPLADEIYHPNTKFRRLAKRLDTIVQEHHWPQPNLIKIDVQGAELEILKGAGNLLSRCDHLIIEMSKVEYNIGSPKAEEVLSYLNHRGFTMRSEFFSGCEIDGDCHFVRKF